jgi:hypothetical protein
MASLNDSNQLSETAFRLPICQFMDEIRLVFEVGMALMTKKPPSHGDRGDVGCHMLFVYRAHTNRCSLCVEIRGVS